jgi:NAD(P)-dependent dehydrogenase (short-subunit alcohol dehydrogenase family)
MATNTTALVTGANRGLGRETCRQLLELGFRVIATARNEREGEAVARELGTGAEFQKLDVTDAASVNGLAKSLSERHTTLDVLVNNAGIALDGFDADVAKRTLDVNFFGPMRVTDALLPLVRDGGRIVMVSSGMGEVSSLSAALRERVLSPALTRDELVELMNRFVRDVELGVHTDAGWPSSAYRVSKVGLNALARLLAREQASRNIKVNAVCPGWVRTDMGGRSATRSVEKGAASIVWAATRAEGSGGFFRDGKPIAW